MGQNRAPAQPSSVPFVRFVLFVLYVLPSPYPRGVCRVRKSVTSGSIEAEATEKILSEW